MKKSMPSSATASSGGIRQQQQQLVSRRQHQQHHHQLFVIFLFCLLSVAVINIRIGGLGGTLCSYSLSAVSQQQQSILPPGEASLLADDSVASSSLRKRQVLVDAEDEEAPSLLSSSAESPPTTTNNIHSSPLLSLSESTSQLLQSTHKRYAYAFYATGEEYACGALVNIQALINLGSGVGLKRSTSSSSSTSFNNNSSNIHDDGIYFNNETIPSTTTTTTTTTLDFIIVTYGFDTTALEQQAMAMNVIIKNVDHLNTFMHANHYYNGESEREKEKRFVVFIYHTLSHASTTIYNPLPYRCHGEIAHLPTLRIRSHNIHG